MSSVSKMTADERTKLVGELGAAIKKHGLEAELQVKTSRETVCALAAPGVEDKFEISVEKACKPDLKEKVDAFKAEAEPLVKDVEGASIKVNIQLGAGCMYDPIKNIVPIKGGEPITLEH